MLVELCQKLIEIGTTDELDYQDKYALLFREQYTDLLHKVFTELNIKFEYNDPDTDYQEDVEAFVNALKDNLPRFTYISKHVKLSDKLVEEIKREL